MSRPRRSRRGAPHAGAEHGFTIIEVLVAMASGIVVIAALFAILEVSLHQTSRITDRIEATQLGRGAMADVTGEMGSACLAREFAPVLKESSAREVRFISGQSEKSLIEPAEVQEHRVSWSGKVSYNAVTKRYEDSPGALTDTTYQGTGGSWPNFTYSSTATSKRVLAQYVYAVAKAGSSSENPEYEGGPFSYYRYASKATTGSAEAASTLERQTVGETGLSAEEAAKTAAVGIAFITAPSDNYLKTSNLSGASGTDRPSEFTDQVTFAFATPAAEATIKDGPCQ